MKVPEKQKEKEKAKVSSEIIEDGEVISDTEDFDIEELNGFMDNLYDKVMRNPIEHGVCPSSRSSSQSNAYCI